MLGNLTESGDDKAYNGYFTNTTVKVAADAKRDCNNFFQAKWKDTR